MGITRKNQTNWVETYDEDRYRADFRYRIRVIYFAKIRRAIPQWEDYHDQILTIYNDCARRRNRGEDVEVDHIVPLCGTLVCGLHVPWNLEIVHRLVNSKKSNKWWPDAPFEQPSLDIPWHCITNYQMRLL